MTAAPQRGTVPAAMYGSPEQPAAARGLRWEPLLWFGACLGAWLLLVHGQFYKTDGPDVVRLLDAHLQTGAPLRHPWHVGYLPALDGFRRLLLALGIVPDFLQLGGWFSALGAAVGVAFAFAGMRRLVPAGTARLGALLLAVNPGMLLFATVVEFHGPVQGALGITFWWATVQIARPRWWGMLGLGGLGHLGFLLHGQALFHPLWLLLFFVARRWELGTRWRDLALAAVAGLAHAALWAGLPLLLPGAYGMWADLGTGLAAEQSIGRPQSLGYTFGILWQEWLWPLLPVSVLVLAAPLYARLRREFVAFVVGFLPFLYLSVRQLVFEPEHGAYLLPMVLPASLLVAQAAAGRWRAGALLAAACGFAPVLTDHAALLRAQRAFDRDFVAAVAAAAGSARPFVLVGSHRELAAAYAGLRVPAVHRDPLRDELFLWIRETAAMPRETATPEQFAGVAAYLSALHRAGRAVLLTEVALRSLEDPRAAMLAEKPTLVVPANETMAGPLFAAHLRQRFDLVPAAPGVLRLVPRP